MSDTIFTKIDLTLGTLTNFIEVGHIGLPDIQRPFVWKDAKVRDLLDSMYRGYPVGYLLFWESGDAGSSRTIGADGKQVVPGLLIVDGQQRLTSLYAVMKGAPIVRDNWKTDSIEIAFSPLEERFEVADAAVRHDKSFISNISSVWEKDTYLSEFVEVFLAELEAAQELSSDDKGRIHRAIGRLHNLEHYSFTAIQLAAAVEVEQVSDIFVRINSMGKSLIQSDFILTLMSVFWDAGRAQLERFSRQSHEPSGGEPSPYNHYIQPGPDQLLRAAVGVAFRRGRLASVYSILRGKDLETGEFSAERREAQFAALKEAQARVLNLQYWHDFFKALALAGYRGERMIASKNTLMFTYTLYLLGRTEYGVEERALRRLIGQWYFMSALTGRYISSQETAMEADLARLRVIRSAEELEALMTQVCRDAMTSDFWEITLPNDLVSSGGKSPSMLAYFASLAVLDAPALFSRTKVKDFLDPVIRAPRSALERHHLFPKALLAARGITEVRDTNQVANFALVEWGDNATIADTSPADYVPELSKGFSPHELSDMYDWHALPTGWEAMEYPDFLRRRRELMARVVERAYERLSSGAPEPADLPPIVVDEIVEGGEGDAVEFKSTLRTNLHTGERDPRMEMAVLRSIAAFLNTRGGTLLVGVADDGAPVGTRADGFASEDKHSLHLVNLMRDRIGAEHMVFAHPRFDDYEGERVLVVECAAGRGPAFVRDGRAEYFFIRTGPATVELTGQRMHDYIRRRFR